MTSRPAGSTSPSSAAATACPASWPGKPATSTASTGLNTVPLGLIFFQGRYKVQYNLLAAASVLVALPVVGTYILTQRHFVAGMMSGSLKG